MQIDGCYRLVGGDTGSNYLILWDIKNVLKIRGSGCTTLNVNELFTLKLLSMLCQFHLNKN